jgi:hypothetical protein
MRSGEAEARLALPAIGHEANAQEAQDHHRPGGRFRNPANFNVKASGVVIVKTGPSTVQSPTKFGNGQKYLAILLDWVPVET